MLEVSGNDVVGREAELDVLVGALDAERLLTVTGPGGVGKTTVALAAAAAWAESRDGSWASCELADVDDDAGVRHAVAAALHVTERPGTALGDQASEPGGRSHVVVLDNCEHVIDAAADVAHELAAGESGIRVLATSRRPLDVRGERVVVLEPLAVPSSAHDPAAALSPAVVLFIRRAASRGTEIGLDDATLPDVVRICRGLDGLPLALELAAASTRVLGVADLADRLGQRFSLLRGAERGTPHRQRTLRAVMDWSYDLLDPLEQDVFCALAVHAGGADIRAVEHVVAELTGSSEKAVAVLDRLVTTSLVARRDGPTGTRYVMLETLREYGVERLDTEAALHAARDRHAEHYGGLARDLRAHLLERWDERGLPLMADFDNLRSALIWCTEQDETADRSFDLLSVMWYLALQYRAQEIAELAERALDRWPDDGHARWSEVAGTLATALHTVEQHAPARTWATAATAAPSSSVGAAYGWCVLAEDVGASEPEAALALFDRAEESARLGGFEPLVCDIQGRRAATLAQLGRDDDALRCAHACHDLATAQGNVFERAWAQHLVGLLTVATDPAAARQWLTAARDSADRLGYEIGATSSTRGLASVASAAGEHQHAAQLFSETLRAFSGAGNVGQRWNTLAAVVPLLVATGRRDLAATVLVSVDAPLAGPRVARIFAPLLDDARAALADDLSSTTVHARAAATSTDDLVAAVGAALVDIADGPGAAEDGGDPEAVNRPAAFVRVGDLWQLTYAGRVVHAPDLRGIRDLAALLARPRQDVAALDLATSDGAGQARRGDDVTNLGTPGGLGEVIDAQARAAYTQRVRDLQDEIDDAEAAADLARAERARTELDFIARELASAYGLHGGRRQGDPAEKARSAVTGRIRGAIAKIDAVHPELAAHLRATVKTGRFCRYDGDVAWIVRTS